MRKICFILLAGIFLSCDGDPIEEGVETTIEGTIYDKQNEIPFENLKLKVAEYKVHRSGIYTNREFIQWIDSTYTDQYGEFYLKFKTSGRGDYYKFVVETKPNIWDYHQSVFEIPYIGKSLSLDLDLLHFYPVNLVIEVKDIEHLPVSLNLRHYQDLEDITTGSGTVERLIYADKNSDTEVAFGRKIAPNQYERYTVIIPATNTSELTNYNLTINNSDFKPTE
ncbi:hypothetical protein SAMN06296241_2054 [Salinimicrobium sediminis]|uniref:Uncharacterized protein n=1 Tax=Salinimicrobium sediminis TaxID=1343891 RepID=A0A285X6U2_9FLAO|nr:hypothetical protein [Salinimicrobium sediminis]SOC80504.1 hypothetical protein SAMN06296241_2054 [Salinimicrobium sediminis]